MFVFFFITFYNLKKPEKLKKTTTVIGHGLKSRCRDGVSPDETSTLRWGGCLPCLEAKMEGGGDGVPSPDAREGGRGECVLGLDAEEGG